MKLSRRPSGPPPLPMGDGEEEEPFQNDNGYNAQMENPDMPSGKSAYNDDVAIPHDLEVIDKRLESDYQNPKVYTKMEEASCFKNCYVRCGLIPQKVCCICASCGCGPTRIISQGEIGILVRFGRVFDKLPPGLHTINSCTDKMITVDMRLSTIQSVQAFTTKDNLTIQIKSFGTWRITHPEIFIFKVDDINTLMKKMIEGVLCTQASTFSLDDLMLKREHIEEDCLAIINRRGSQFGFKFQNIEFNEITLPRDILNAVSASALARRNAEAKLIEAQAEIDSAMMYKQAADEVSSNPISLQLQWLETMKDIAKSTVSTLVLPDTVIGPWDEILAGNGNMK